MGWEKMLAEGCEPSVWVAPAHTFDKTTVRILLEETRIRTISDGLSSRPFTRLGMGWFPQQLWRPRACPAGIWTLCLHPNDHTPEFEGRLGSFLADHGASVASLTDLPKPLRRWGPSDWAFSAAFLLFRTLKRMARP